MGPFGNRNITAPSIQGYQKGTLMLGTVHLLSPSGLRKDLSSTTAVCENRTRQRSFLLGLVQTLRAKPRNEDQQNRGLHLLYLKASCASLKLLLVLIPPQLLTKQEMRRRRYLLDYYCYKIRVNNYCDYHCI